MSNYIKQELELLKTKTPDSVILQFYDEIEALCNAFMESGQSGASAPYVARAISNAVEKLCLYQPLVALTGQEDEWTEISRGIYQNKRNYAVFKNEDRAYYLDGIIWRDKKSKICFSGLVYKDSTFLQTIDNRVDIQFPIVPKEFYVDVIEIHDKDKNDDFYVVDNLEQLVEVEKYYNINLNLNL